MGDLTLQDKCPKLLILAKYFNVPVEYFAETRKVREDEIKKRSEKQNPEG